MEKAQIKEAASNAACGVVVGASMLIPGVSGGTTAIILGIYDRLIASVSNLFKKPKQSLFFLCSVGIGALVGIVCFARVILTLVQSFETPMMFLFMGAVLGSIPLLCRKAHVRRFSAGIIVYPGIGLLTTILLALIPAGLITPALGTASAYLLLLATGVLLSIALVLPGISASYMLLILGLYQPVLSAVKERQFMFLIVLAIGVGVGTLAVTKTLETAMNRYPRQTYLIIIGFVLAALRDVYPGIPQGTEIIWSILLFAVGFTGVYMMAKNAGE